ncbi:HRDC domain-containing protein [Flavobacterium saliperosum]|uniref:HRDC domain-containing protein n=1 Tax=Flavobacterium saliperosum TaxID=329186 RepID=A0A1G4W6Y4_9FLAO|nr:HRDC domain-containing protein [Flavobacterium saliperosum]SCX17763.1 HRDC domain-containing protein [Flavobacterium saliperosum]
MNIQVFTIRIASEHLLSDQKRLNDFLQQVKFVKSTTHFVASEECQYWSVLLHYETPNEIPEKKRPVQVADLTPGGQYVFECLKQWRTEKAERLGIPKFMVCHNSELINIVLYHPKDIEGLKKIKGFGAKKAEKYGEDIITVLNAI